MRRIFPFAGTFAGAMLLAAAFAVRTETRDDIQVRADRTEVRASGDSVIKEYLGHVRIWNRSVDAESHRAVFESTAGVFRMSGSPKEGERGRIRVLLRDEKGRAKAVISARTGALFVHGGTADSASANGAAGILWVRRNARATADSMRWSAARKRIWADGAVTLTAEKMLERGTAFEADDALTWYTMRKVSGTIRTPRRK